MILLEILRTAASRGLGTEGVDLFIGTLPSDAGDGSLFVDQGGQINADTLGIHTINFQVFTRSSSYQTAQMLGQSMVSGLVVQQEAIGTPPAYHVFWCYPRHDPAFVGHDDTTGYFTFVVNYSAKWRVL